MSEETTTPKGPIQRGPRELAVPHSQLRNAWATLYSVADLIGTLGTLPRDALADADESPSEAASTTRKWMAQRLTLCMQYAQGARDSLPGVLEWFAASSSKNTPSFVYTTLFGSPYRLYAATYHELAIKVIESAVLDLSFAGPRKLGELPDGRLAFLADEVSVTKALLSIEKKGWDWPLMRAFTKGVDRIDARLTYEFLQAITRWPHPERNAILDPAVEDNLNSAVEDNLNSAAEDNLDSAAEDTVDLALLDDRKRRCRKRDVYFWTLIEKRGWLPKRIMNHWNGVETDDEGDIKPLTSEGRKGLCLTCADRIKKSGTVRKIIDRMKTEFGYKKQTHRAEE